MTIGEKITVLRNAAGMSQDALADSLSVSRQSVSKWEMDQALPQIDKVLQLCEIFKISTDQLLYDKIEIKQLKATKNKYFGTDGIRANHDYFVNNNFSSYFGKAIGLLDYDNIYIGYWIMESGLMHAFDNVDTTIIEVVKDEDINTLEELEEYENQTISWNSSSTRTR